MIFTFSWGDPYQSSLSARGWGAYMASGELKGLYIDILVRFSMPEATSSHGKEVMAFHIPLTCLFIKNVMMPTRVPDQTMDFDAILCGTMTLKIGSCRIILRAHDVLVSKCFNSFFYFTLSERFKSLRDWIYFSKNLKPS